MSEALWTAGEVAKRCGIKVATLHFYETKGLIASQRNPGNQRRYRKDVVRRVSLIKAAQILGISLEEIRLQLQVLPAEAAPSQKEWRDLSKQWRKLLKQRIEKLHKIADQLDGCIVCGCLSMKACSLHKAFDFLADKGPGPVLLQTKEHK